MWAVLADSHLRKDKVRRNLMQRQPRRRVAHERRPGRVGAYISESQLASSEAEEPRQAPTAPLPPIRPLTPEADPRGPGGFAEEFPSDIMDEGK